MKYSTLLAANSIIILFMGISVAVYLKPGSWDFHSNALAAAILLAVALSFAWKWSIAWSNSQNRTYSPARFHRLQRALYRRASLVKK